MRYISILFFFVFVINSKGQVPLIENYTIKGQFLTDCPAKIYLFYFKGENIYLVDSTQVDTVSKKFQVQSSNSFPQGVYLITDSKKKPIIELLMVPENKESKGVNISLELDPSDYSKNKISGSYESIVWSMYNKNLAEIEKRRQSKEQMFSMIQRATRDADVLSESKMEIRKIADSIIQFKKQTERNNPESFVSSLIKVSILPDIPIEKISTREQYFLWLKNNFFDSLNIKDSRLIFSKELIPRINQYLENLSGMNPDSISSCLDLVIQKCDSNKELKKHIVEHYAHIFDVNQFQGSDRIFVHLTDKYILPTDTSFWPKSTLKAYEYKADFHRPNLTGNIAPDLILPDSTGRLVNMKDSVSSYTLLIFYSPKCKHCQEKLPEIKNLYEEVKSSDFKIFAINTDGDPHYWKYYIHEHSLPFVHLIDDKGEGGILQKSYGAYNLPVLYLLDKNKRILLKRPSIEMIRKVLAAPIAETGR
jgi:peroxiredoxin